MSEKLNARACPLCDQENLCGLAAGKSKCWCFYAKLDPDVAELVKRRELDAVCLCQACASGEMSVARREKFMRSLLKHR